MVACLTNKIHRLVTLTRNCPNNVSAVAPSPATAGGSSSKKMPGGKYVPSFIPPSMQPKPKAFGDSDDEDEVRRIMPRVSYPLSTIRDDG